MQNTSQAHQPATSRPAAQREAQPGNGSLSAQLARSPLQAAQSRQLSDLRVRPLQRADDLEERHEAGAAQLQAAPLHGQDNRTGMPDGLKAGIESLSGVDMSDVRVHRNSSQPAQLNALAYAQGNDIHLGPGQEQHLPHEAWHVVQQRQGRVQATMQMKNGVPVNDDEALEQEADSMGELAASGVPQMKAQQPFAGLGETFAANRSEVPLQRQTAIIQRETEYSLRIEDLKLKLEECWQSSTDKKHALLQAISDTYTEAKMVDATKDPAVAKAVLDFVNSKQSKTWRQGTERKAPPSRGLKPLRNADDWTLRHCTAKYVWDPESKTVKPPPYTELLSALTLAAIAQTTEQGPLPEVESASADVGDKTGASKSGHTTAVDWSVIGNVGDTFFALFHKGKLAGQHQTFLDDAQWYAEWKISDIDEIWASSDWLSKAKLEKGVPQGEAYEGRPADVISAHLGWLGRADDDHQTQHFASSYENFEVKVHGSLSLSKSSIDTNWKRMAKHKPVKEEQQK